MADTNISLFKQAVITLNSVWSVRRAERFESSALKVKLGPMRLFSVIPLFSFVTSSLSIHTYI